MTRFQKYYARFKTEPMYLWNDDAGCYIRSVPTGTFYIKFPNKEESEIASNTDAVTMAIQFQKEVTKEEYDNA